jgi:ubiquitin-like-conjugating enzyme ATG10
VLHWDDQGPIGLDAVYRYLVPEPYRKQLKNVGVMGGISFGVGGIFSPPFSSLPLAAENETKRSI